MSKSVTLWVGEEHPKSRTTVEVDYEVGGGALCGVTNNNTLSHSSPRLCLVLVKEMRMRERFSLLYLIVIFNKKIRFQ